MKTRNTITKLIAITITAAALVLLCGTALLPPVAAQIGDGSVKFVSYASIGIVPGEKVRLSVANDERATGNLTLSFSYYLAHGTNSSSTVPVYESEWMRVAPGEFRSSELSRKDFKTEGDQGTGRAQLLVKMTIFASAGINPDDLACSLEVTKDEDGDSAQIDSKYRLIILAAKRSKQLAPISFYPGEQLSYTFFNPNEEGSQPVRVQAYVYDAAGRLMTQTDPVELLPGQVHTARIDRDALRVAGEKVPGRVEVRAGVQTVLLDGSVRHVSIPVWMELVDKPTGSTTSGQGDYFTGTVSVSGDGF